MTSRNVLLCCTIVLLLNKVSVSDDLADVTRAEKLFALHVKPLFEAKCLACHGADPDDIQASLDLRTRKGMLTGGETFGGDVLKIGDGQHSQLYVTTTRAEEGFEMPPKEADKLTLEQQRWIQDWIDAGAPWPTEKRILNIQDKYAEGEIVVVSKALSEEWQNRRYEPEKLWAYRPIMKPDVPKGQHPVDWLIDRRLNTLNLAAAPRATALALSRRMSYGLTGLPPASADVAKFTKTYQQNPHLAVEEYSAALMSSVHYGEHFGSHWLDVVRYADTAGFANDYCRPHAWRYRDYVVRSFNDDRPYDEFIRQQIAGDELDVELNRKPENKNTENLIATGFLRMGPWEQTSMSVFKETRGQWLDDVTDIVGQTFLAHSMLCCKCHDHKFDPVPTRDYYRMRAVFSTTQFAEREAAFLPSENQLGFEQNQRFVETKIQGYEKQRDELKAQMVKTRTSEDSDAKVGDNGLNPGDEASSARMGKNISRHKLERNRDRPLAYSVFTGSTVQHNNIYGRLVMPKDRWKKGKIERDVIHSGGDVYAIGDDVVPGALSAAESISEMPKVSFPAGQGSRRKALADWMTVPSNPLTARVIVNRVWSWHFGQGIAGNPSNFGGTGALPTHPELLDFLAAWFMENGWSVKKLNRLITSSNAYQRSTFHSNPDHLTSADPLGQSYAAFRSRRLSAEELRDSMLYVSGELNAAVGGIPCRPDINKEVAMQPRQIMGGTASVYEPSPLPSERNRRTLYAERIRGVRDPFLESFNQPGPDKSCELRETSTVAPQALTLLNSQEVLERSIALAVRLLKEPFGEEKDVVQRAFEVTLGRKPQSSELSLCVEHWRQATVEEEGKTYRPTEYPSQVVRTVMAEKTGKPYSFVEFMPTYESYEPDLQPSDVDARTRGLAFVCRVLLNSNEFSYVD